MVFVVWDVGGFTDFKFVPLTFVTLVWGPKYLY